MSDSSNISHDGSPDDKTAVSKNRRFDRDARRPKVGLNLRPAFELRQKPPVDYRWGPSRGILELFKDLRKAFYEQATNFQAAGWLR